MALVAFKRALGLRPVHSDKKENTWSNLAQNASTVQNIQLVNGVTPSSANTSVEVIEGSTVNTLYFEFHFSAQVTTNPKVIHWKIEKTFSGTIPASVPSTYYQIDRSKIFKRGMEMLPADQSTVFKRIFVVRLPRAYRRIGFGERIYFSYICSSTETINACGIEIHKALL